MALTPEQVHALRSVPLGAMPNKVRLARTMLSKQQREIAVALGVAVPVLSEIERGEYKDVALERARALAAFFGCEIVDLFPAREAVSA